MPLSYKLLKFLDFILITNIKGVGMYQMILKKEMDGLLSIDGELTNSAQLPL